MAHGRGALLWLYSGSLSPRIGAPKRSCLPTESSGHAPHLTATSLGPPVSPAGLFLLWLPGSVGLGEAPRH